MYADDTVLYTSNKTSVEGLKVMEENLGFVTEWCNNNKLTVNIAKTKHMVVGNTPGDNLIVRNQLCHNNQQIELVTNYNYLGVELDSNLTLENHINKCVKNANKKMFMVSKLRRCLTNKTTSMLYKQLVRPHLEYCDFVVDSSLKKNVAKYDKVQKRALRTINYGCAERKTFAQTMEIYEIEDLYERRKEHLLMQMYMQKDDVDFVETVRPNMKLRNNDGVKFKITTTRNHRVYNSPYYRGVYLWERLPVVVQTLASKSDFRKRIKVL